jgi:transcriptional regulator GlxA family with amidase domain
MQIAIVLYDHVTALDAVGPYEVLSRLPCADVTFVAEQRGAVRCDSGRLALLADAELAEVMEPDVVVVPGWSGSPQDRWLEAGTLQDWLLTVDRHTTWTASVGTGSIVLAAAGLLIGRRAVTHWLATDRLAAHGVATANQRVVVDGKYVTAAGVSAGLDMALRLAAEIGGDSMAMSIQLAIEYEPQPPFDAGSAATAPAAIVTAMTAVRDFILDGAG